MSSPPIRRLFDDHGYPEVDLAALDELVRGPQVTVLFFTGDPKEHRETNDVAVILPELVKAFPGRLRPALVARAAEKALQARYGLRRWPALVFLREQGYLGAITGVQNWSEYLDEIQRLLQAEPTAPPGFGIPVVSEEQPMNNHKGTKDTKTTS